VYDLSSLGYIFFKKYGFLEANWKAVPVVEVDFVKIWAEINNNITITSGVTILDLAVKTASSN